MALSPTLLEMTDMSTKWGRLVVLAQDNTVIREVELTADEAESVRLLKPLSPRMRALWDSGRVMVETRPCLAQQCVANPDGTLIVNTGIVRATDRVNSTLVAVPKTLWNYDGRTVFLDDTVIRQLGL